MYYNGYPRVADLLSLTPWLVLRCGMRRWQVDASAARGCVTLRNPSLASILPELEDKDTPAILLLERLAIAGWTRGQPPLEHTLATSKQFSVKDPIKSKAYMQCLLRLPELVGEGRQLDTLRSDQASMYYSCVLANKGGQQVPLGQKASCYTALLAFCDQAPALQDKDDMSVCSAKSCASSDELMVVPPSPDRRGQRGRGRGRGGRRGGRSSATEADWGALVLAAAPQPPLAIEPPEAIGGRPRR